ncbi:uncharacterized protein BT62DRAFT_892270 [Guyanagaster necrorhizus]|uniref:Protein YAE1 n=1 Tax=Guyanagaster necrorhizus TaxID=856835 RepID=A0A9P8AUW5_9AGAR|nr:uncharacterized protein BT62DRAFT_892270 [Guyanagaster necrorhizus MCA 3950]KAG7447322.1 hypothetical protein BT62DRAFT_892270 [Guyanagaster necrorhizus MCA 3950]
MDSDWDEEVTSDLHAGEAEWTKMSSEFTNTGYREGITAGKEAALQEGFDAGFAQVGVPIGHELGLLRGIASVLAAFLSSATDQGQEEARSISSALSSIRFSDIAPRDLEAEEHAREHLEDGAPELEEIDEKKKMEDLEDMLNRLSAGKSLRADEARPTLEDLQHLRERLKNLMERLGLDVERS